MDSANARDFGNLTRPRRAMAQGSSPHSVTPVPTAGRRPNYLPSPGACSAQEAASVASNVFQYVRLLKHAVDMIQPEGTHSRQ